VVSKCIINKYLVDLSLVIGFSHILEVIFSQLKYVLLEIFVKVV